MIRSLADRIHDCPQMSLLYPNHPKDQAIGKYYSSPPETVTFSIGDTVGQFFIVDIKILFLYE